MSNKEELKDDELLMSGILGVFDKKNKESKFEKKSYNIWFDLFMIIITAGLWIFWVIYRTIKNKKQS